MCGRYKQTGALAELKRILGLDGGFDVETDIIAPGMLAPVIRGGAIATLRWGFVPGWSREDIGTKIINARSESCAEKPSFRQAFMRQRCAIPANGFFEWDRSVKPSQPYDIHFENDAPFAFGGLWDRWQNPATGEAVESFAIVTRAATPEIAGVHDRMPVILRTRGALNRWLSAETALPVLSALIAAPPEGLLLAPCAPLRAAAGHDLPEPDNQLALF
ncbi:MAG: SOS response-associated peptidase [Micavibrio sp.]|nr:SOS response-associated peptidase [Micavibrio sp.]